MGIAASILDDWHASLAALAWQLEAGVDTAFAEEPVNRYEAGPPPSIPVPQASPRAPAAPRGTTQATEHMPVPEAPKVDPVAVARSVTARAVTLEDLRQAALDFEHCELKKGARNTVFCDGNPKARVLILGEAPGREEDIAGRPFVGAAGQLLDRMFGAIGLSRQSPDTEAALYITNVLFWRPPGNRDPSPEEIEMMRPFVDRHIALVDPEVIVVMGNTPLMALTGNRGILRARGRWTEALGRPLLPMTHPAYLLRNPIAKREAWADLCSLRARLRGGSR